jgi:hypothetical protein
MERWEWLDFLRKQKNLEMEVHWEEDDEEELWYVFVEF